jgi:hypothetical protein
MPTGCSLRKCAGRHAYGGARLGHLDGRRRGREQRREGELDERGLDARRGSAQPRVVQLFLQAPRPHPKSRFAEPVLPRVRRSGQSARSPVRDDGHALFARPGLPHAPNLGARGSPVRNAIHRTDTIILEHAGRASRGHLEWTQGDPCDCVPARSARAEAPRPSAVRSVRRGAGCWHLGRCAPTV